MCVGLDPDKLMIDGCDSDVCVCAYVYAECVMMNIYFGLYACIYACWP